MYQKVKTIVFALIYLLLWSRYFLALWDPAAGNIDLEAGMAPYREWRGFIDGIYNITRYLVWPAYTLYNGFITSFIPPSEWFPGISMPELLARLAASDATKAMAETDAMKQACVGYLDWLTLISAVFYWVSGFVVDIVFDFGKNAVWNLLIEFSFTKRKEARYQEALDKRAEDLMKLNVQYKSLSKEASKLAQSVITDEMTQVYNKRFFIEKMTYEFKTAKQKKQVLAIAMVDIDHFKKLNDNYGHLMGDKVLKAVAQVAKSSTPNDCFCCRFGGEEFSIIMPKKNLEDVLAIVSKVHKSLPLLRFEDDPNLRTSASFGVCLVDFKTPEGQAIETFEDFIKLADDELYRAKLNGRNRIEHKAILPSK